MWKKVAIAAGTTAAVLGAGGAALALDTGGTSTPTAGSGAPAATATSTPTHHRHPGLLRLAGRAVHGQWVTRDKNGTFVTHDAIKGQVQSVSATSITIAAADGFHQTYRITADTKVHIRDNGTTSQATIGQVKSGEDALVAGVQSKGVLAARQIVVRVK